jgi:hypothetical protein
MFLHMSLFSHLSSRLLLKLSRYLSLVPLLHKETYSEATFKKTKLGMLCTAIKYTMPLNILCINFKTMTKRKNSDLRLTVCWIRKRIDAVSLISSLKNSSKSFFGFYVFLLFYGLFYSRGKSFYVNPIHLKTGLIACMGCRGIQK